MIIVGPRSPEAQLADSVSVDPLLDLVGIEPDELADLHVQDSSLGHQPPNEPHVTPSRVAAVATSSSGSTGESGL